MSAIIGWRIQVRPQFCDSDLTTSVFINVRVADREAAIAVVRNREEAEMGEKIYAVRPLLRDEEEGSCEGRVIPMTDYLGVRRAKVLAHKTR